MDMTAAKPAPGGAGLDDRLLLLSPGDSVVVARVNLRAGEHLTIDGRDVVLDADAALGFKIARGAIGRGERILKYGAPIGSAARDIAPGAVVHLHNMKSDYLPTRVPGAEDPSE